MTIDNGVLELENESALKCIVRSCPWIDHTDIGGGQGPDIPDDTRLAVRLNKLDKHGLESVTNLWALFGVWDDSEEVKIQKADCELICKTIADYVLPRTFTADRGGIFSCMADLISVTFNDPWGNTITRDSGCVFDHIHVDQSIIDKYDLLLGVQR